MREASEQDFDGVLREVAEIGYDGVEPFNLFGMTPRGFRERVEDLGMQVAASHYPWANRSEVSELVDVLGGLGLSRAVGGFGPDDFADLDAVKRTAETTNELCAALAEHGITLALHNHWWEFDLLDGQPAYHHFQAWAADVQFEIDTYWASNFGACDPAAEVSRVQNRAPLLHIKDGPLEKNAPMVAVGSGRVDVASVVAAADPEVLEWCVVELDACATDMMEAIRGSYPVLRHILQREFEQ